MRAMVMLYRKIGEKASNKEQMGTVEFNNGK
jgi:hypothetical protein